MALHSLTVFLIISLCSACSSELPRLSATQMEAINHNMRGIKAEARGNHQLALEEFKESLRVNSALDNTEGKIVALVNISRVSRGTGEINGARTAINQAVELIKPESPIFGEVAFEKSCVELASKDIPQALDWARKAIASSTDKEKAAATNLLARILHQEKQYLSAREQAEKALSLSRQNGVPVEEANALRLLGALHLQERRSSDAIVSFSKALELDKVQGKSRKIALDLQGLADAHAAANQNREALEFYRHAQSVSLSDGDIPQAAEDLLRMARLLDAVGDKTKSMELMQERETLLKGAAPQQQPKPE